MFDVSSEYTLVALKIRSIWICCIVGIFATTVHVIPSFADSSESSVGILMIGCRDSGRESREAAASVHANMVDLNATIQIEWVDTLLPLPKMMSLAKRLVNQHQPDGVFWQQNRNLYIFIPGRSAQSFIVRPLGEEEHSQENSAHAIGLIVGSTLASLLSHVPFSPSSQRSIQNSQENKEPDEKPEAVSVTPNRSTIESPVASVSVLKSGELKKRHRLFLSAGYFMESISDTFPLVHGGRFGLKACIFSNLYGIIDYSVVQHLDISVLSGEGTLTIKRHPIGIGLQWIYSPGRWRLGLGTLLELDIVAEIPRVNAGEVQSVGKDVTARIALVPHFLAEIRIVSSIFAIVQTGVRVATEVPRYYAQKSGVAESIYSPRRLQPRLFVGLGVSLF